MHKHQAPTSNQLAMEWPGKPLQRQDSLAQDKPNVDKKASILWLRRDELFPETKGFVVAIQDKVICTRNCLKHILRHNVDHKCHFCRNPNKTTIHIMDGCMVLFWREYTRRHNDMCRIIHLQISSNLGLLSIRPSTSSWQWTTSLVLGQNYSDKPPCRRLKDLGIDRVLMAVQKAVLLKNCLLVHSFLDYQEEGRLPLLDL